MIARKMTDIVQERLRGHVWRCRRWLRVWDCDGPGGITRWIRLLDCMWHSGGEMGRARVWGRGWDRVWCPDTSERVRDGLGVTPQSLEIVFHAQAVLKGPSVYRFGDGKQARVLSGVDPVAIYADHGQWGG